MTPFFKQSITRALCAAAWGLPGALWWATPALAGESTDHSWAAVLTGSGFSCVRGSVGDELRLGFALARAVHSGEYADSLRSIAANRGKPVKSREWARHLLSAMGEPAPARNPAPRLPYVELPPLTVRASP